MISDRWDRHFLQLANDHARMSKDPSTKVGAVIVGPDREIVSAGFNGFPRGIADTQERLHDRNAKLMLVVHAEMNAVLAAARRGVSLFGCTIYSSFPPCTRCAVEMIQAGISEVVSPSIDSAPPRWQDDFVAARNILIEAGVTYREIGDEP